MVQLIQKIFFNLDYTFYIKKRITTYSQLFVNKLTHKFVWYINFIFAYNSHIMVYFNNSYSLICLRRIILNRGSRSIVARVEPDFRSNLAYYAGARMSGFVEYK